jgi:hypothetical protein
MSPREDRVNGIAGKHPRGCESFEETSTETD